LYKPGKNGVIIFLFLNKTKIPLIKDFLK